MPLSVFWQLVDVSKIKSMIFTSRLKSMNRDSPNVKRSATSCLLFINSS